VGYWPKYKEQLISKYPPTEVLRRLEITVKPVKKQSFHNQKLDGEEQELFLFNGLISGKSFSISKVVDKPDNFLPLINGKVLPFEQGSRVLVQYSLFKSVNWFFGFWFFLLLALTLIAYIEKQAIHWLVVPVIVQLCSYILVVARFKKGIVDSRKELIKLIC
jgi:hypothetical protein